MRRVALLMASLVAIALVAGCGNEPPIPGEILITSSPEGAAITIDGVDTGLFTPATIVDLEGGSYQVTVSLDGVTFRPATQEVQVIWGERTATAFQTGAGILTVTSTPADAAIYLDGVDTGEVTPATLLDLDPGQHVVDLALPYHRTAAGARTVTAEVNTEVSIDFDLVLATVALFEGFSNVRCVGCPAMANDIHDIQVTRGYGPDRLVYVKYAGPVPYLLDPMYRSNRDMVDARMEFYTDLPSFAHPTLFTGGELAGGLGTPVGADAMAEFIDTAIAQPAAFYLAVEADGLHDLESATVNVSVDLMAPYASADLSGHTLRAVLVYEEVHTDEHFEPGGDEYHWVARSDLAVSEDIGEVDGSQTFAFTLTDPDPAALGLTPADREVIVFVQNNTDRSILQAGSTMITEAATTAVLSGGYR